MTLLIISKYGNILILQSKQTKKKNNKKKNSCKQFLIVRQTVFKTQLMFAKKKLIRKIAFERNNNILQKYLQILIFQVLIFNTNTQIRIGLFINL